MQDSRLREALPARAGQSTDASGRGGITWFRLPPPTYRQRYRQRGTTRRTEAGRPKRRRSAREPPFSSCRPAVERNPVPSWIENARGYKGLPQKTMFAGSPDSNNDRIMIYVSNTGCDLHAPGPTERSNPPTLSAIFCFFHQRHECVSPVALPNVAPARWSTSCSCRLYLRPLPCVA